MPEVGSTVQAILWDVHDPNTVVVATKWEFQVYICRRHHQRVDGGGCRSHPQMPGAFPVLFSLGKVTCQVPGGRIHTERCPRTRRSSTPSGPRTATGAAIASRAEHEPAAGRCGRLPRRCRCRRCGSNSLIAR